MHSTDGFEQRRGHFFREHRTLIDDDRAGNFLAGLTSEAVPAGGGWYVLTAPRTKKLRHGVSLQVLGAEQLGDVFHAHARFSRGCEQEDPVVMDLRALTENREQRRFAGAADPSTH